MVIANIMVFLNEKNTRGKLTKEFLDQVTAKMDLKDDRGFEESAMNTIP